MQQPKVGRRLASVRRICGHSKLHRHLLHLGQQLDAALQHCVHSANTREVQLRIQILLSLAQAEEVARRDIALHDFGEQIVQRLVGVCDEKRALVRVGVVEHIHDLHRHVRLAGARRANNHAQAGLHTGEHRFDLHRCESDVVGSRAVLRVRPWVRRRVGLHHQRRRPARQHAERAVRLALAARPCVGLHLAAPGEGDLEGGHGRIAITVVHDLELVAGK
mmetsp:Transcript_20884/g.53526  ORF Transcript_20884/g.53526 Transcript_20884/m.53526 type:complete len:220 (+) Transcript_20884:596-1255(+)